MSMAYWMKQTSDPCIDLLARRSDLASAFVRGEDPSNIGKQASTSFFSRLFGKQSSEKTPAIDVPNEFHCDGEETDLDKSWHGLHYLLSGTDWESPLPEGFLLNAGIILEGTDHGYGDARGCNSAEVKDFAVYLGSISDEQLSTRFDPQHMTELEIYPQHWEREDELDYLIAKFQQLKPFIQRAAERSLGLVCMLS
jgi:hypothetical protein